MFTQPLKKQPRRLTYRSHTSDGYDIFIIMTRPRYRIASYPSLAFDTRRSFTRCFMYRETITPFSHYALSCHIQHIFSVTCFIVPPTRILSLSLLLFLASCEPGTLQSNDSNNIRSSQNIHTSRIKNREGNFDEDRNKRSRATHFLM